ncbi:MAG: Gfo/Idh/MocA family oxidoreductase [Planctomycetota bacterium]|jgi:predicted dehydrogenase|nr:Gfo/Idh/MocA family oxidoreductase [Planctomycetota bacterium]MDP6762444.1 Gfo/Idh/MocA family oxidoreductase [Planctomycetota bacterium]MDP6989142.1 Gfo/Idh/MocA family oxidoreductase [Planctomycetota bacterium]
MTPSDRRQFLAQATGALAAFAIHPDLAARPSLAGRDEPLPVALIGAGRQGRAILSELQKLDGVSVVAVCDVLAGRLRSGLRRAQGARGYDDHEKLLAELGDAVDSVIVATPTHLHRKVVTDALEAGKNVYCEAPLAHTVEDARAIAAAARASGRVFATGLQGRSNPVYQLARSFYRSGSVRDLASMRAQDFKKQSWRTPASNPADEAALNWRLDPALSLGLPGELGTQQFDVFHYYRGEYPVSVRGRGGVFVHRDGREVADTASVELTFADGTSLFWEASLGNSYQGRYELLSGSMAAIKLAWSHAWMFKEADAPTQGWEVYANRQTFHNDEGITLIADATQLASQGKLKEGVGLPHSSLYYALEDFLAAAGAGGTPACGAAEGLRATVVGILAQQAVTSGGELAIDPEAFEIG